MTSRQAGMRRRHSCPPQLTLLLLLLFLFGWEGAQSCACPPPALCQPSQASLLLLLYSHTPSRPLSCSKAFNGHHLSWAQRPTITGVGDRWTSLPLPLLSCSWVGSLGLAVGAQVVPACLFCPCPCCLHTCWAFFSKALCPMMQLVGAWPSSCPSPLHMGSPFSSQQHGPSGEDWSYVPCSGPTYQCPAWQNLQPLSTTSQCLGIILPVLGSHYVHFESAFPEDGLSWLAE